MTLLSLALAALQAPSTPVAGTTSPALVGRLGETLLISAETPFGRELVLTDGTSAGTSASNLNPGPNGSDPGPGLLFGERLLFAVTTAELGREPWVSDGTLAGTHPLLDLSPGAFGSLPSGFVSMGTYALFAASRIDAGGPPFPRRVYRTDGTAAGTFEVPGSPTSFAPNALLDSARLGSRLVFSAGTPATGLEPWIIDESGAQPLGNLFVGPFPGVDAGSDPGQFVLFDGRVCFSARADGIGRELFATDGTPAGTQLVVDLPATSAIGSSPELLGTLDSRLLFLANTPEPGTGLAMDGLWALDAGSASPQLLIALGQGFDNVRAAAIVGDRAVVAANFEQTGFRFVFSDGTVAGTTVSAEQAGGNLLPIGGNGPAEQVLQRLGSSNDIVVAALDSPTGRRLWRVPADGSAPASLAGPDVSTLAPSGSALVLELGGRLLFAASDPSAGSPATQFYSLEFADIGLGGIEPYGAGFSNTSGPPRAGAAGNLAPGGSLDLGLAGAEPGGQALAWLAPAFGFATLPDGVTTYLAAPQLLGTSPVDAAGTAQLALGVPNLAALVGADYYVQWVATESGGPLLGAFASSNALELTVGP